MSQPFSGMPDPGNPRPMRRRFQPGVVQEALRAAQRGAQDGLRAAQRGAQEGLRRARLFGGDLWLRGKRKPRTFGLIGGAVALTLVGAYALSASGAGRSLCPPAGQARSSDSKVNKGRNTPRFLLLMDPVPHPAAGSEVEIHYDVCGLPSGTAYRGRVQLSQQRAGGKKKSAKPKPLVVTFRDQVDGLATRRSQQLVLGSTRPGTYTLELSVVDAQGRERKRLQKLVVKAR
jgi:hypothetical protein